MELVIFKVAYVSEEYTSKQDEFLTKIIKSGYSSRLIVDEKKGTVMRLNKNEYGKLLPDGASSANMTQMLEKYQKEGLISSYEESRNGFNEKEYKELTKIKFGKEEGAFVFDNPRYYWDKIVRNEVVLPDDKEYIVLVDELGCAIWKVNEIDSTLTQEPKGFIKRENITNVIVNPERKEIYISYFGKKIVEIFHLDTFKKINSLTHQGWVYSIAYCENDRLVCADGDGFLTMWNLGTGEAMYSVRQPMEYADGKKPSNPKIPFEKVVSSPEGTLLATAAHDAYKDPIVVWKAENGDVVAKCSRSIFSDNFDTHTRIAGFADQDTLVLYEAGEEESAVFYYRYATGEIKTETFQGKIVDVSFSGKYVLILTADNRYQLYTGKESKTYSYVAGRNARRSQFSGDETRLVLPGEEALTMVLNL